MYLQEQIMEFINVQSASNSWTSTASTLTGKTVNSLFVSGTLFLQGSRVMVSIRQSMMVQTGIR